MIKRQYRIHGVYIFVSCSENEEERKQLETLVRETEYICSTGVKTGLWIVSHWICNGHMVAIMSLREKATLDDKDILYIQHETNRLI